ncbi:MAG: hypothetical protein EOO68_13210 [Moraxellaceae bacterium]|nr:MAG: hypothetical protein EOO68_13210 [Moraxellaceae bacterium]
MTLPQYCRTARGNLELSHRTIKLNSRQRALLLMIDANELNSLSQQQFRHLATADNLAVLLQHQLIAETEAFARQQSLYHALRAKQAQATTAINGLQAEQDATHGSKVQEDSAILIENPAKLRPVALVTESTAAAPVATPDGLLAVAHTHSIGVNPINADSVSPNSISRNLSKNELEQQIDAIPDLTGQDISAITQPAVSQPALTPAAPVFEYLEFEQIKQLMMSSLRQYCGLLASALIKDIQYASSVTKLRLCQMRWVTTLTETRASRAQIALWVEQINFSLAERHESPEIAPTELNLTL